MKANWSIHGSCWPRCALSTPLCANSMQSSSTTRCKMPQTRRRHGCALAIPCATCAHRSHRHRQMCAMAALLPVRQPRTARCGSNTTSITYSGVPSACTHALRLHSPHVRCACTHARLSGATLKGTNNWFMPNTDGRWRQHPCCYWLAARGYFLFSLSCFLSFGGRLKEA